MDVPPALDPALFGPEYFLGEIADLRFAAACAGLDAVAHALELAMQEARRLIREREDASVPEAEHWRPVPNLRSRGRPSF